MENSLYPDPALALRVLLVGDPRGSSISFSGWLWDRGGCVMAEPPGTIATTLILAFGFQPHVVIFDFDGLSVPMGSVLTLFKEVVPAAKVFVLTHALNHGERRRREAMGADAVFHKTEEFDELAAALASLRLDHNPRTSTLCTSVPR